jgi:hypothetical protein
VAVSQPPQVPQCVGPLGLDNAVEHARGAVTVTAQADWLGARLARESSPQSTVVTILLPTAEVTCR